MTEDEQEESKQATPEEPGLDELLAYLVESRGFDFVDYKRTGLARRLRKRLTALGLSTLFEYTDYLQVHPDEFGTLFNAILINATGFFRDPASWEYIAAQVLPRLIEQRKGATLRIWSAGCATGQEAYSIAMLLADALGLSTFGRSVKIYATDVDGSALTVARQGMYSGKDLGTSVPEAQLARYFEKTGDRYTFSKELRRSVIFGQHNLLHDAPISRVDLLLCRNTLMYFNADAQSRILSNLHFALNDNGVLFLGKAEMLLTHAGLFTPLDRRRLFTKTVPLLAGARLSSAPGPALRSDRARQRIENRTLREAMFELAPVAQLGFDLSGRLAIANEHARITLGVGSDDMDRSFSELRGRRLELLRPYVEQAVEQRQSVRIPTTEWTRGSGDSQYFDILALPVVSEHGLLQGVQVSFQDVTGSRKAHLEVQQMTAQLETAHEELQSASEELETANEELQSTVEELETTNEELQSTNEELETTNEELRSTNEELQSMNEELRERTSDLGLLNIYFESILASLDAAVVVLDGDLLVEVWSSRAQDMWGVRSDEARGKSFVSLDIGLPVTQLMGAIGACLTGASNYQETTVNATNRRGRAINCRILLSRLHQPEQANGVIMLMSERDVPRVGSSDGATRREDVV